MTNKEYIKAEAAKAYEHAKSRGYSKYNEARHCLSILEVMLGDKPFISEFCRQQYVAISTVNAWKKKYATFKRCYEYGLQAAHSNWIGEAEDMKDNEEFNMEFWKLKGSILFQLNQSRRLKVHIEEADTPMEQYKNIMIAAADGEYTATEIKQIMESINVGIRAYESDTLAKRIDEIEADAKKMGEHNGSNISTLEQFKKAN